MTWVGEFDPEDRGRYQRVCLWLTDRWDLFLHFKYNWRGDLRLRRSRRQLDKLLKKAARRSPWYFYD